MAFLAKQGWRILQNENSLLQRIYKSKYFPNGSFFQSKLGPNPSYAWRGIFEAKRWLMAGCRWRVGTYEHIKIWKDSLVLGYRVLQPVLDGRLVTYTNEEDIVDSLIDQITRTWKVQHVRALFNPRVADDILKIRLSTTQYTDKWIWAQESNGRFSVKSVFHMIQNLNTSCDGESSTQMQDKKLSRSLWQMKVPRKVKTFAWKACKEILLTLTNLRKKMVAVDDGCCFCKEAMEDVTHALLQCPQIQELWQKFLPLLQNIQPSMTFMEIVRFVMLQGTEAELWVIFSDVRKAGIGVVMRDDIGEVLMAASKIEREVDDAATIELLAVLRGLQLWLPLGIPNLVIESDCLVLVEELQASHES